jgi:hypothetical protein
MGFSLSLENLFASISSVGGKAASIQGEIAAGLTLRSEV